MKIQVKLCQCKTCKAGRIREGKYFRKNYIRRFRKLSRMFLKGYGRDPLDYLSVPQYTY